MITGTLFLTLFMLPYALSAEIIVTPSSVTVEGDGCIHVFEGSAEYVYVDNKRLEGKYPFICGNYSIKLSGELVIVGLDENSVNITSIGRFVTVENNGRLTIVTVYPFIPPLLVVLGIAILFLYAYVWKGRKHEKDRDLKSSIIELLTREPGLSQKKIAEKLNVGEYQVSRVLKELESEGVIVRIRKGVSKSVYLAEQLQRKK